MMKPSCRNKSRACSTASWMRRVGIPLLLVLHLLERTTTVSCFSQPPHRPQPQSSTTTSSSNSPDIARRAALKSLLVLPFAATLSSIIPPANAANKPDCYTDCNKNCRKAVPNDTSNYCRDTCLEYCQQDDRRDGLSGSVSSEGGEMGILGGGFGQGTVVQGEDKPPTLLQIPGLNFQSAQGKKLLGL